MLYLVTNEDVDLTLYKALGIDIERCTVEESLEYLETQDILGVDTETTGFFPQVHNVLLLQIGNLDRQYVIDAITVDIHQYKEILENKTIIMHNGKFDIRFFFKHSIFPRTNIYDSYLAESIAFCGILTHRKGLDKVVERYCGITLDKTTRGKIHYLGRFDPEVIEYAADDVKYLPLVKQAQEEIFKRFDLMRALELDNLAMPAIAYIEYFGLKLDIDKWKEKMKEDLDELNIVHAELDKLAEAEGFTEVNWMSPKQVIPFFKHLGVSLKYFDKKTKEEKESVDKKILIKQAAKYKDNPKISKIINTYLEYRRLEKLVNTYGESILKITDFFPDKRVRTTYSQVMRTGRMSSGGSFGKGKNKLQLPNMQNIPRKGKERGCFTPEEGNLFLVADYSGQENLILAEFSRDANFYAYQVDPNKDMHSFMARLIFWELLEDKSDLEIKSDYPEERQFAKGATFAFGYGGNDYTIHQNLSLPMEISTRVYNSYKQEFPGLQRYFKRVASQTFSNGYILINPTSGRKSFISDYHQFKRDLYNATEGNLTDEDIWSKKGAIQRASQNYPIQGTGSDMIKLSLYKIYEWICKNDLWGIVLIGNTVHDEIVLEFPEEMADQVAEVAISIMKESANKFCSTIPMKVGYEIGKKWTH